MWCHYSAMPLRGGVTTVRCHYSAMSLQCDVTKERSHDSVVFYKHNMQHTVAGYNTLLKMYLINEQVESVV